MYEAMTITQTVDPVNTTGEECCCVGVLVGVPCLCFLHLLSGSIRGRHVVNISIFFVEKPQYRWLAAD